MEVEVEGGGKRYALLQAAKDSEYVKKVRVLQNYDGFEISGSPHDAYANGSWILGLHFLLQTLDAMEKKLLGIVLCRTLGGIVGKAETGWDIEVRKVEIMESSEWKFNEEMGEIPSSLSIIECHQDEVWEIPFGAQVMGFSDQTAVEILAIGGHILGIKATLCIPKTFSTISWIVS
ncbi:Gamma-glutamyl peptidase 3, partial [Cucurbita argyrosperma subsp. argyrosperma]